MDYSHIHISNQSIFAIFMMITVGLLFPTVLAILWKIKERQKISTMLIGMCAFAVFSIFLESIPRYFLFQNNNPLSQVITNNIWLYGAVGALLASLFEESARLISFKFILKGSCQRQTAISYGIGHGGFEMMYILFLGGLQYLSYALAINSGQFQELLKQVGSNSEQLSAMLEIPSTIASISFVTFFISFIERISALLLQLSCSIMVFSSVNKKNTQHFILALVMHFLFDFIIVFYYLGIITNIIAFETIMFILAVALFILVYKILYKKYLA